MKNTSIQGEARTLQTLRRIRYNLRSCTRLVGGGVYTLDDYYNICSKLVNCENYQSFEGFNSFEPFDPSNSENVHICEKLGKPHIWKYFENSILRGSAKYQIEGED